MGPQDEESIIEEFLGDAPRATQWRALRQSLGERLGGLRRTRSVEAQTDPGSDRVAQIDKEILALERQVAALQTEEVVAEFVENSLHVTLARSAADAQAEF